MSAEAAGTGATAGWPRLGAVFAGEGRAWLFVAKTLLALYVTALLAMWLHLERPATAMITVGVVMNPHSGMVLAKSFYRALGTLGGSAFGLALMCAFPQQRVLFFSCLALWLGLCAGGATLYRNFMAYGFVLAGYTAAIVAVPAIADPAGVFDSALMRVSEVLLGIVVAGVVSDLVFPVRLRPTLRRNAHALFTGFVDFVRASTGGSLPRAQIEQAHLRFVRAAVQLENLRASVIFEDPEIRARSARMRLLNHHHMAAATSFQSLHHLINRLQCSGADATADALIALYGPLGAALDPPDPAQRHDPNVLAPRLHACARALPAHAEALRARAPDCLAFATGEALVRRFLDELRGFVEVDAALRAPMQRGSVERVHFHRGNDPRGALVAVLRTALTMGALSVFWVASGWSYGGSAMVLASVFSGLFAASSSPLSSAFNMLIGYTLGTLAELVAAFGLLPDSSGIAMLVLATAPLLVAGPWLNAHGQWPGVGGGYALGAVSILALQDPMVYAIGDTLNEALAQLVGVAMTTVAFVFLPRVTGSVWQRRRQIQRLREQVAVAGSAPLSGLAWRFESTCRDLFLQVVTHTREGSAESRQLLAWALAVQESGRALIELRQQLRAAPVPLLVQQAVDHAVQAIMALYRQPDAGCRQAAEEAVRAAIAACASAPALRPRLYQLLGALRDAASPVTGKAPARASDAA